MKLRIRRNQEQFIGRHRGTVLVMTAVFLTAFMAFVALAVDLGVLTATYSQLQTVADAAALAGARQLASDRRMSATITDLSPEMSAARAQAIAIGQANYVLSHAAQINDNPTNSSTGGDVLIGYLDPKDPSFPLSTTATTPPKFNSVRANAIRSSDHVGIVPAFFGRVIGSGGSTINVASTATVNLHKIKGYNGGGSQNASILPIVMSKKNYDNMMNSSTGDSDSYTFTPGNYTYPLANNATNGVSNGADGIKESVIYPVPDHEASNNWGTINFGVANNSTSTLGNQISQGITPAQMQNEFTGGQVTLSHQFSGNTGISAGIEDDLTSIIGKPVSVPIFDPATSDTSGGNGNLAWYRVVAYASVRIVAVHLTGIPKYVIVQPALNNDPTAIPDTDTSDPNRWTQGGVPVVHLSRKD